MSNNWTLGTDLSHWAGDVDFGKMYDAGARWTVIKASDANRDTGWQWEDVRFDRNARQIFERGQLLAGCYHWLQASLDPKVAADFYLERYRRFDFHFPPVLDFEEKSVFGKGLANHYAWCAEVWLDYVHKQTGRLPIVYTANWFTNQFDQSKLGWMRKYPLWVASYPWIWTPSSRPVMPGKIWDDWTFWQYSADNNGRGREFGVTASSIDLNWFKGTYTELLSWLQTEETPEPPTPPKGGDTMYVIEMLGNLRLRQTPNGAVFAPEQYALLGEVHHSQEEQGGWYKITRNGITGWISGNTQWTRITEVEADPVDPDPEPLTLEERVAQNEIDIANIKAHLGLE